MKLVILTWRQEELLAWQPLFDICQAKHTHTVYIQHTGNCFKHWLRLEKLTTLHGSNKHYCLHSSRGKQLQNVTNLSSASFLLQHTHTLSQHSPPQAPPALPPTSTPLPWAPFSRLPVSGGRLWRQQLNWALCQPCGPLMDAVGLRNSSLWVECTAQTQPSRLKHI